jgi:hypothetical protein
MPMGIWVKAGWIGWVKPILLRKPKITSVMEPPFKKYSF